MPQHLGVVTAPGHPLAQGGTLVRLRDCLEHPLVMMSPDMELRTVLERVEPRFARLGRPLVETGSVPMVRQLVAGSQAIGFLIPENVDADVRAGTLAWRGLEDAGAHLHSCVYQRAGHTTSVAMGLFLAELEAAGNDIHARYEAGAAAR